MMMLILLVLAIVTVAFCCLDPCGFATWIDGSLCGEVLNGMVPDAASVSTLQGILIAQVAALLAICVTVFVFLFEELNSRAQDHLGERVISNALQKDFALRVEWLSIESIALTLLNYFEEQIYNVSINGFACGRVFFALLVVGTLWVSADMVWYCVGVAQYKRHLKWRAFDLTNEHYERLCKSHKKLSLNGPESASEANGSHEGSVSGFWNEYRALERLVCTVAGDRKVMDDEAIGRFEEVISLGENSADAQLIESLRALCNYQTLRWVLEAYQENGLESNGPKNKQYALPVVAKELERVDRFLDFWNVRFRKKPPMKESYVPGDKSPADSPATGLGKGDDASSSPLASRITRDIWMCIVRGSGEHHPMRGQRLNGMSLSGLDFSGGRLGASSFRDCRLVGANFAGSNLDDARFEDCDLRSVSFAGVICKGLSFSRCNLSSIKITEGTLVGAKGGSAVLNLAPEQRGGGLVGIGFDGCSLVSAEIGPKQEEVDNASLEPINLTQASFAGASFENATISHATLTKCTFADAWLSNTVMEHCEGESVNFAGMHLVATKLDSCKFRMSNFFGCTCTDASFEGCQFTDLSATDSTFENAYIAGVDFSNASLARANLLNVQMKDIDFDNTELEQSRIVNSNLEDCRFVGSTGVGVRIRDCVLHNTLFDKARLPQSDFTRTTLKSCTAEGTLLSSAIFRSTNILSSRVEDARLVGADFSDATFSEVRMRWAYANGALFDRVRITNSTAEHCIFTQASFRRAQLQGCTFNECEWSDVSFDDATIADCDFTTTGRGERKHLRGRLGHAKRLSNVTVDGRRVACKGQSER